MGTDDTDLKNQSVKIRAYLRPLSVVAFKIGVIGVRPFAARKIFPICGHPNPFFTVNGATTNFLAEWLEKGADFRATIDSV